MMISWRNNSPVSRQKIAQKSLIIILGACVAVGVVFAASSNQARARDYDAEIQQIQKQIDVYESETAKLREQADTLQNTLKQLANDKSKIQAKIDLYKAENERLTKEIDITKARIEENKLVSGELIINDAVSSDVSPIIRLAGSDNLAKFIDGSVNDEVAQQDILEKIDEIERLKQELSKQQEEVKKNLDEQTAQRELLTRNEQEQQSILDRTKGDEAAYQSLINSKNEAIESIRAQQAAAIAALQATSGFSGGRTTTTDYEYQGWATNYNDYCKYPNGSSGADRYGYCVRQCTSYVAWKLDSIGNNGYYRQLGHAYSWWGAGATVSASDVGRGDVIVLLSGYYGHVMFVEGVSGDTISFTDYNGAGGEVSPGQGTINLYKATSYPYKVIRF